MLECGKGGRPSIIAGGVHAKIVAILGETPKVSREKSYSKGGWRPWPPWPPCLSRHRVWTLLICLYFVERTVCAEITRVRWDSGNDMLRIFMPRTV